MVNQLSVNGPGLLEANIREIEHLNYLFLRTMGKVFLSSHADPSFNEMTGAQKRILYFLDIEGPRRMGDIARLVAVSLPAATAVVDRLVRAGVVSRRADPADRRVIRVALSPKGHRTMARMKRLHERRLKEILDRLPVSKRRELVQAFARIHDLLCEIDSPTERKATNGRKTGAKA
jgi:DNA-binding MarR family transcriptional regulator